MCFSSATVNHDSIVCNYNRPFVQRACVGVKEGKVVTSWSDVQCSLSVSVVCRMAQDISSQAQRTFWACSWTVIYLCDVLRKHGGLLSDGKRELLWRYGVMTNGLRRFILSSLILLDFIPWRRTFFRASSDAAKAKDANTSTTACSSSENRPSFPTIGWSQDTSRFRFPVQCLAAMPPGLLPYALQTGSLEDGRYRVMTSRQCGDLWIVLEVSMMFVFYSQATPIFSRNARRHRQRMTSTSRSLCTRRRKVNHLGPLATQLGSWHSAREWTGMLVLIVSYSHLSSGSNLSSSVHAR